MHCLIVSEQKIVMFFFKCILLGIAFISPFCCLTGDCANISERTALHAKLLNSSTYNLYVRPVENSSLPVSVQFRFAPVIHYLVWDDHRLTWNPDDYGGLRSLDLPVNKIWQPELILYERIPSDTDLNIQVETEVAKVLSNGTVYWYTMASTRSFCFIDIKKFPFDKQNCDVTFTTWMHLKSEQLLYHNDDLFINDTYKRNEVSHGEWHMTHFHHDPSYQCLYCVEDQSYITYKTTLERFGSWRALVSFVIPCIVVEAMTVLNFCFPAGDAEVATYGLTCVLALVVFLPVLYSLLPSTDVCFIGIYAVVFMTMGTCVTIAKVFCWSKKAVYKKKSSISIEPHTFTNLCYEGTEDVESEQSEGGNTSEKGNKSERRANIRTNNTDDQTRKPDNATTPLLIGGSNEEYKINMYCMCVYIFLILVLNLVFFLIIIT